MPDASAMGLFGSAGSRRREAVLPLVREIALPMATKMGGEGVGEGRSEGRRDIAPRPSLLARQPRCWQGSLAASKTVLHIGIETAAHSARSARSCSQEILTLCDSLRWVTYRSCLFNWNLFPDSGSCPGCSSRSPEYFASDESNMGFTASSRKLPSTALNVSVRG